MLNVKVVVELTEFSVSKLFLIVHDERMRDLEPENYALSYEVLDLLSCDFCKGFDHYSLGKIVYNHEQDFSLPRSWGKVLLYPFLIVQKVRGD